MAQKRENQKNHRIDPVSVDIGRIPPQAVDLEEAVLGAIMLEKKEGDLLVVGASEEGLVRRAFFGDLPEALAEEIGDPVILVKRFPGHVKSWLQQLLGSRRPQILPEKP